MIAISVSKNDLNETKLKCPAVTFTETGIQLSAVSSSVSACCCVLARQRWGFISENASSFLNNLPVQIYN